MNILPRPTERRLERPESETSDTGIQTSLKYAGPVPRIESKAVSAILNSIRCGTGSQWRTSRMAGVMWLYFPTTKRAAAFSTICSWRVTCEETLQKTMALLVVNTAWYKCGCKGAPPGIKCQWSSNIAELQKLIEAGSHHIPSVCIHSKFTVEYDSQVTYFL